MINKVITLAGLACVGLLSAQPSYAVHNTEPGTFVPTVAPEMKFSKFMLDRLEYAWGEDEDTLNWDAQFWYGTDTNRLWIETEGEDIQSGGSGGQLESFDVMYSRMIAPYWDVQAGLGYQTTYGPGDDHDRGSVVVALQGLARYWFETDAKLRFNEGGAVSAELEAEYDWLLSQRLILQPRFSTYYSSKKAEAFGIGQGINSAQVGLRLRYEIRREFAPYIGVYYRKLFGETADMAEEEGEDTGGAAVVAGVRVWF